MKLLAQELLGDIVVVIVAAFIGLMLNPNINKQPPEPPTVHIVQHNTIEQPQD
jgi:hypothetical protein